MCSICFGYSFNYLSYCNAEFFDIAVIIIIIHCTIQSSSGPEQHLRGSTILSVKQSGGLSMHTKKSQEHKNA